MARLLPKGCDNHVHAQTMQINLTIFSPFWVNITLIKCEYNTYDKQVK